MIRVFSSTVKLISIVALAILIAGGGAWFFDYWTSAHMSDDVGEMVPFQVTEDDDTSSVSDRLADSDLIRFPFYFETRMRLDGGALKPGQYELRRGMSVPDIINEITVPDPDEEADESTQAAAPSDVTYEVTFIEGQRLEENAAVLEAASSAADPENYITADDYIAAAQDANYWRETYDFLADVPENGTLEGFLFPSTYTITVGATPNQVIERQLVEFQAQFTPEMIAQAEAEGLTVYQAVTVGSLVEREAALAIERPQIAEVYLNRIDQDMALNADPAQQYGVGTPEDWWPQLNTDLLEQSKSTPYDTYNHTGLPPGPISNPGFAALQAVVQPATEGNLFFVTSGTEDGSHIFTTNLDDHNRVTCEQHPDWDQCQSGYVIPSHAVIYFRPAA